MGICVAFLCTSMRDIIDCQRPLSRKHKPMSRRDRAAQFASFAALTGYEDMAEKKQKDIEKEFELKDR